MMDSIREALHELHGRPHHGLRRFDAGGPLPPHIVVLPSAFNPPTWAHFRLLALARATLGSHGTAALLTTKNVDKGLDGAPLEHRVGMLLAAVEVSPHAILTTNAARFVDQAAALTRAFPEVQFDFVAGYDTLIRIFDQKYYADMGAELEPFFARHRLLATNRGAAELDHAKAVLAGTAAAPFAARVVLAELDAEAASMSSSHVRSGLGDHMVAPAVHRYIREHGLYREDAPQGGIVQGRGA
ncbi:MAG: hypothetical protein ACKVVT_14530 [Dehalococcoidia bacterium]